MGFAWFLHRPTWQKGGIIVLAIYLVITCALIAGMVSWNLQEEEWTKEMNGQGYDIVFPGWVAPWMMVNIIPILILDYLQVDFKNLLLENLVIIPLSSIIYFASGAFLGAMFELITGKKGKSVKHR